MHFLVVAAYPQKAIIATISWLSPLGFNVWMIKAIKNWLLLLKQWCWLKCNLQLGEFPNCWKMWRHHHLDNDSIPVTGFLLWHFSFYAIDIYLISGSKVFAIVKASWEEEKEYKENNAIHGHFWRAVLLGTIWQMQNQVRLVLRHSVWIWRISVMVLNMLNFSLSYFGLSFPCTLKLLTEKPRMQ